MVTNQKKDSTDQLILFFGNSLTAGYNLSLDQSFPMLIQDKIDSLGLNYQVMNAGNSGETTSGGVERIDWMLKKKVDVFVLELGANDALRGQSLQEMRKNLTTILDKVRAKYPQVKMLILGMEAPPNLGKAYTVGFRNVYRDLATKYDAELLPFLLKDVATEPDLLLEDNLHPNAKGQKIVAEHVWEILRPML